MTMALLQRDQRQPIIHFECSLDIYDLESFKDLSRKMLIAKKFKVDISRRRSFGLVS